MDINEVVDNAHRMCRVLKVQGTCTCVFNVPYDSMYVKRRVVRRCQRCIVIEQWERFIHEHEQVHCA